ncbi:R3H and coiled-coil domain-containing protein 1 [Dissophora globulifera]|nr:R3H and coiled-coil domain-containing protein 1 [Dissophora globulifera]
MSDSGSATPPGVRRPPKVGVYVPRHRRGNEDAPAPAPVDSLDTRPNSTAHTSHPFNNSRSPKSNTNASKEDPEDGYSSRSGNSSGSEVQRRGRGKFMGPNGSGSATTGGSGGGSARNNRDQRSSENGATPNENNSSTLTASSAQQQSSSAATLAAPRHPRGRDFDATVLRRYSDDEGRPNSSFSRSSSYNSGRSTTSGTHGNSSSSAYSPNTRPTGRNQDISNSKKTDRVDEGSWRRTEQESEQEQPNEDDASKALASQLERIELSGDGDQKDDTEVSEELEEWELALQDSDDESIPKLETTKSSKATKPHPAEHLLSSPTSKTTKTGTWSEVSNDDMYILELYDFSPSIKTMHLTDMFAPFEQRSGGFRIKWVDDTRALVIFESAAVAKQAYIANLTNQISKIKPYNGADRESIRNAGNPSSGAYNGIRPAKTDSVARRLVQGALGLRVRRTPEQIAEEKALVQAAKEAREAQRQEQQRQRQEMDAVFDS